MPSFRTWSSARWTSHKQILIAGLAVLLATLFGSLAFAQTTNTAEDTPRIDDVVAVAEAEEAAAEAEATITLSMLLSGHAPSTVEHLAEMQAHVQQLAAQVIPATVGVRVGRAQGSGVIISQDGYVLTAAHVIGGANRDAVVIMPDGKELKARTLGLNRQIDSGLMKIVEDGAWQYLEIGESQPLQRGQWVMAIGHPGGFDIERSPVVRLGRILFTNDRVIRTDCTLVGGDSGGPLVNMDGEVVGIHSRIGRTLDQNMHVPVDIFTEEWDDLVDANVIGATSPFLGFSLEEDGTNRVTSIVEGGPADQAGVRVGDLIVGLDETEINSVTDLRAAMVNYKPGDQVTLHVVRGTRQMTMTIELGAN